MYLDLKDEKAVLSGVAWKGVVSRFKVQPEQGLEVIVTGKITTFPGQSKYQIIIDAMEKVSTIAEQIWQILSERYDGLLD